jgi:uncharacterized membrane protein
MTISGALAAIALLSNSVPILIGSMILAPAMPPLFLVPLGLVAGQRALVGRGLGVAAVGMALGFLAAVLTTWLMDLTGVIPAETYLLDKPLLEGRLRPGWWSVAAAVAAGLAGVTAQASNNTDALIGTVAHWPWCPPRVPPGSPCSPRTVHARWAASCCLRSTSA